MSFRSHSASAAPSLSRRPHLHFLPLSLCCSPLISLSCASHSSLPLLSARLNRDQFISQITSGHRRQLQALRSISYSPPPLPLPTPSLPSNVHFVIPALLFSSTAHAIKPLPPPPTPPPPPPRLYALVNPPQGLGVERWDEDGRWEVFQLFFLLLLLPGSLRCSGSLPTRALKRLQSARPGTLITGLLQSPDPS